MMDGRETGRTKSLLLTALFAAFGVVLPVIFHSIPGAGSVFLPMHIPVLMCGLSCGGQYGLVCAVIALGLSHLLTGMPPAGLLPSMACELSIYGLLSGALYRRVHTGIAAADIYVALIGAMLSGRVAYGVLNALIFQAGSYSIEIWVRAAFVTSFPGIVMQLTVIPGVVLLMRKMGFIRRP